jgi:hypothetical protein
LALLFVKAWHIDTCYDSIHVTRYRAHADIRNSLEQRIFI